MAPLTKLPQHTEVFRDWVLETFGIDINKVMVTRIVIDIPPSAFPEARIWCDLGDGAQLIRMPLVSKNAKDE